MDRRSGKVRRAALDYLEHHQVMTLATAGSGGPWAAAVFYANHGFDLFFLSADDTRHVREFTANPRAAATIQEDYKDWSTIKGIQLEGSVRKLTGAERREAIALYQKKFPFIISAGAQIQSALRRVSWYRLTPDRLYYIDNSQGLGHRDQIELDQDG